MLNKIMQNIALLYGNFDFIAWLGENPDILFQYAFYLVYTLPATRYTYY
jgi:hypothetical protein